MLLSPWILALAVSAAPRVAVVVHTTGFSDEDARKIGDKARAEVGATGVELWALGGAVEVKAECLEDRACAKELLRTAEAGYLVSLNVLRAGGQASLSAALIDAEGRVAAEAQGVRKLDRVLGEGALLGDEILAPLVEAARPPPADTPPATTAKPPVATPLVPEPTPPPPAEGPEPLSALALGGVATLGVGALAAVAGGAVVAAQLGVLNDPASLREQKEQAALVLIPAMGTVALVGVAVAGVGGALLWLGLDQG